MKLAIVGIGLIGGSFALAARAAGLFATIVGVDNNSAHAQQARTAGLVDQIAREVPDDADAVLLSVPSDCVPGWLATLSAHRALVFDVASVKAALLDAAQRRPRRFVPCHPIAGSERNGPSAAQADLFADHLVIVTPDAQVQPADLQAVTGWWQQLGAQVQSMDSGEHDRLFARTSHLPHLAAFAYMQLIEPAQLAYAAGGFRDFSRIAASDPDMWTPILRMNRRALLAEVDNYRCALDALARAIDADDGDALHRLLRRAQSRRQAFDER